LAVCSRAGPWAEIRHGPRPPSFVTIAAPPVVELLQARESIKRKGHVLAGCFAGQKRRGRRKGSNRPARAVIHYMFLVGHRDYRARSPESLAAPAARVVSASRVHRRRGQSPRLVAAVAVLPLPIRRRGWIGSEPGFDLVERCLEQFGAETFALPGSACPRLATKTFANSLGTKPMPLSALPFLSSVCLKGCRSAVRSRERRGHASFPIRRPAATKFVGGSSPPPFHPRSSGQRVSAIGSTWISY